MKWATVGAALVLATAAVVAADAPLKSGPSVGAKLPGPFEPLHVNGPDAGEKSCLYCKYGAGPVAMVFARHLDPATTALVGKLEEAADRSKDAGLNVCVIFCSDEPGLKAKLADLAKTRKLQHTLLCLEAVAGPEDYDIAKDADVTALLYVGRTVRVNHAYAKGKFTEAAAGRIAADLGKIVKAAK